MVKTSNHLDNLELQLLCYLFHLLLHKKLKSVQSKQRVVWRVSSGLIECLQCCGCRCDGCSREFRGRGREEMRLASCWVEQEWFKKGQEVEVKRVCGNSVSQSFHSRYSVCCSSSISTDRRLTCPPPPLCGLAAEL